MALALRPAERPPFCGLNRNGPRRFDRAGGVHHTWRAGLALLAATRFEQLTVAALRQKLRERGLLQKGSKAELVARLEAEPTLGASGAKAELCDLTVAELRKRLRREGLPVYGRKVELLQRLSNGNAVNGHASASASATLASRLPPNPPPLAVDAELPAADAILEGKVTAVMVFGVFVELSHVWGLVPLSELPEELVQGGHVREDAFQVGQTVRVKVVTADEESKIVLLGVQGT
ncbi:unnamed protein product [Effrenium voratum]|nr:unnamed protein product [Effrenium voratum]